MKLSVELSNGVDMKQKWLHGRGIINVIAMPTLLRAVLLSKRLQKTKRYQNSLKTLFVCFQVKPEASKAFIKNFLEPSSPSISGVSGLFYPKINITKVHFI